MEEVNKLETKPILGYIRVRFSPNSLNLTCPLGVAWSTFSTTSTYHRHLTLSSHLLRTPYIYVYIYITIYILYMYTPTYTSLHSCHFVPIIFQKLFRSPPPSCRAPGFCPCPAWRCPTFVHTPRNFVASTSHGRQAGQEMRVGPLFIGPSPSQSLRRK